MGAGMGFSRAGDVLVQIFDKYFPQVRPFSPRELEAAVQAPITEDDYERAHRYCLMHRFDADACRAEQRVVDAYLQQREQRIWRESMAYARAEIEVLDLGLDGDAREMAVIVRAEVLCVRQFVIPPTFNAYAECASC